MKREYISAGVSNQAAGGGIDELKGKRKIEIETEATVFERSVQRHVIVSVEPSGLVGFRLKGTRRTYHLPADAGYCVALKADVSAQQKPTGK